MKRNKGFTLIELMIVIAIIAIIAAIAIPNLLRSRIAANEQDAAAALKQITSHEAVWQRNDEDGNAIKDYYTFDVAGLHYHTNALGGKLAYIDIKFAKADFAIANVQAWDSQAVTGTPTQPAPAQGYHFFSFVNNLAGGTPAGVNDGVVTALNVNPAVRVGGTVATPGPIGVAALAFNANIYAFGATPNTYDVTGVRSFIVNQAGVRYQRDLAVGATLNAQGLFTGVAAGFLVTWPVNDGLDATLMNYGVGTARWAVVD